MNEVARTSIILSERDELVDKTIAWHLKTIDLVLADHSLTDEYVVGFLKDMKEKFSENGVLANYHEVKDWAVSYIDMLVYNLSGDCNAN